VADRTPVKLTAANLLLVQDGRCLAVSRRNDATKWGLPGGKVDPGETNLNACIREAFEETGLMILPTDVTPIVSLCSTGDVNYWTTTYLYVGPRVSNDALVAEEGLFVNWLEFHELANPNISPFAEYNLHVWANYKQYTGE